MRRGSGAVVPCPPTTKPAISRFAPVPTMALHETLTSLPTSVVPLTVSVAGLLVVFPEVFVATQVYVPALAAAHPVITSWGPPDPDLAPPRSEEHTSELQSLRHLVCRL